MTDKCSTTRLWGRKVAGLRIVLITAAKISLTLALALSLVALASHRMEALAKNHDSFQDEQGSQPLVVITQVDSEVFPQVTAYVSVIGADGLPVESLTAEEFSVLEDGVAVPATSIAVEQDNTQSFGMVLALDISTDPENLLLIQEAVKPFIDTLIPQDQLAITVFFDEVQVAHDFTGDKNVLNATINALGAQGNYTALNQAILDSVTLADHLEDVPTGRKVVVVLTDSRDNRGNVTTADAVSQVVETGVPIYTIGFGEKVSSEDLEEIARLTQGQFFYLASPEELQDRLSDIEGLLRKGYKVTFQSGVQADNREHDFSIGVTDQGLEGRAQGHFMALSSELNVSLSGVVDGQQLGQGDLVNVSAQAEGRASIASVELLFDGEPVAQKDTPPYSFEWDSADAEPGTHTLSVKAVDSAGNVGQEEVTLVVVSPVGLIASVLQDKVELGDEVVVQVQVNALAGASVSGVEFLLDDRSLGVDDVPPYVFVLDSAAYSAGQYVVTVRAEDSLGRVSETDLDVQFLQPPEPEEPTSPDWSAIAVTVIVSVILAVALGALVILIRSRKTRYKKAFRLEISNQGNVSSRYELQAQDPTGTFEFAFALGGTSLEFRSVPTATRIMEAAPEESILVAAEPARGADAGPGRLAGAREVAGKAAGAGGALAGILSTVATLLPGSAGSSARRAGSQLRRGQTQAGRADRLAGQASRITPKKAPALPGVAAAQKGAAAPVSPAVGGPPAQEEMIRVPRVDHGASVRAEQRPVAPPWALTPFVEPGETLMVDFMVNPIKSYQSQYHPITLLSRSVEQKEAAVMGEDANIHMVRPSWLRRFFPYLVVLSIMLMTVALYLAFLDNAGILVK